MATAPPDPIPSGPRRFAIRLPRPLWIGVTAAVLVVVAVGLRIGVPIYQEQMALREVERLGGQMIRRDSGPAWLRRLLHDQHRYLYDLPNSVAFVGTAVTDDDLAVLHGLPSLQGLLLKDTQVTDAGLVHLKTLTKLKFINVQGSKVTDAGIAELQNALPGLKVVK